MESILARALEYTLKYWLKSFTRDQFKLQGRTAQLSNLGPSSFSTSSLVMGWGKDCVFMNLVLCVIADINGEAIHASMGLPPALSVTTAKVGKLEIMVCSVLLTLLLSHLFSYWRNISLELVTESVHWVGFVGIRTLLSLSISLVSLALTRYSFRIGKEYGFGFRIVLTDYLCRDCRWDCNSSVDFWWNVIRFPLLLDI